MKGTQLSGRVQFTKELLLPKYWPTWLGFGALFLLVNLLPHRVLMHLGAGLGLLSRKLAKTRRKVVQKNLALCFPELGQAEREHLSKEAFSATGRGLMQGFCTWFWPKWRSDRLFKKRCDIEGLEHFEQLGENTPTILLSGHFACIEIASSFIGKLESVDGFYRRHNNAAYEYIQRKGRERVHKDTLLVHRADPKTLIKRVKSGRKICYFPDQDLRGAKSVFSIFMGQPAATVTATSTLAKLAKARVVPYVGRFDKKTQRYTLKFFPEMKDFPSGTDEQALLADAKRVNEIIEEMVRFAPEQYFWMHRRFKTREDGSKNFYET